MGKGKMVLRAGVLAGAMVVLGAWQGCALLQPPVAVQAVAPGVPAQSQQVSATLDSVTEILAELKAARGNGVVAPASQPSVANSSTDKETQILTLLTASLQQLNASLQNAPSVEAQRQIAFATGIQTVQSAAVTFGGQYGALIAAGLGIVSVLIQGMTNTSKAHQTAQAANATAQALAGRLPPAGHPV